MDGDIALNIGLVVLSVLVLLMFGYILCYSEMLTEPPRRVTIDVANAVDRELLMRENLADTVLSEGQAEWQCIVCLHLNHPQVEACHLCGSSQEASTMASNNTNNTTLLLNDTAIMGNTMLDVSSTGTFLSSYGGGGAAGGGASGAEDAIPMLDMAMATRQRALRYRRLNRMQLTQRQRSAQRRKLWQRVKLLNGTFLWVRTAVPPLLTSKGDSFIDKLRNNNNNNSTTTSSSRLRHQPNSSGTDDAHHGLSDTIAEQLHRKNAATMGFYSELDDHGNVRWKNTTDALSVAIAISASSSSSSSTDTTAITSPVPSSSTFPPPPEEEDQQMDLEGLLSLPFKQKKKYFVRQIAKLAIPFTNSLFRIKVRRSHVFQDSFEMLGTYQWTQDQCKEHLNICFVDEPALDAGGVLREWFLLVVKELFKAENGLFLSTMGENPCYWINPNSKNSVGENHLQYYTFAGRLFGKAMLEGLVFDAHVALPLLKHFLSVPITFSDLEFLDQELYKSCMWMKKNSQVESLCVTFSVENPQKGGPEIELKKGGKEIDVNDGNKLEYLQLLLKYRMLDCVAPQLSAMLAGLYEVIPKQILCVFDYQELDFFLCGLPEINVFDWQKQTRIRHFANENTHLKQVKHEKQVVLWFWEVVQKRFNGEERARLLQFATGSSRVPVEGFKALTSASGYVHPFTLQLVPRSTPPLGLCPRAHTCFNRIDLPIYKTKDELETYLTLVIQMEITGFGLE